MSYGSRHAFGRTVVERHHAYVVEWELQRPHALLLGHPSTHATVYLVGKPVFAGHSFELKELGEVGRYFFGAVVYGCVIAGNPLVGHHRFGRRSEEVRQGRSEERRVGKHRTTR